VDLLGMNATITSKTLAATKTIKRRRQKDATMSAASTTKQITTKTP
jgi:hypothetical protein